MKKTIVYFLFLVIPLVSCQPDVAVGKIVGDPEDLEVIGVRHGVTSEEPPEHLAGVERILKKQASHKILCPEKYGNGGAETFYNQTTPDSWVTEEILKTHHVVAYLDERPQTEYYSAMLEAYFVLLDQLVNEKKLSYEFSERDGIPVCSVKVVNDFVLTDDQSYLFAKFYVDVNLVGEKPFEQTLAETLQMKDSLGRKYLHYVGAKHAYELWMTGKAKNVYFALDDQQLKELAYGVALYNWGVENLPKRMKE